MRILARVYGLPEWLLIAVSLTSAVLFVATLVLVPRLLVTLPADWFVRQPRPRPVVFVVAKNLLGVLLVALGVAMLVLPGQGLLTMVLGIALLDIRWKHTLLLRILGQRTVRECIDTRRARSGAAPLLLPEVPRLHRPDGASGRP